MLNLYSTHGALKSLPSHETTKHPNCRDVSIVCCDSFQCQNEHVFLSMFWDTTFRRTDLEQCWTASHFGFREPWPKRRGGPDLSCSTLAIPILFPNKVSSISYPIRVGFHPRSYKLQQLPSNIFVPKDGMEFWTNGLDVDVDVRLCCGQQAKFMFSSFLCLSKRQVHMLPSVCCCGTRAAFVLMWKGGRWNPFVWYQSEALILTWDICYSYVQISWGRARCSYICMLKFAPNLKAYQKDELFCQRDAMTPVTGTGPGVFLEA